ncbi:helix-turn-helix domain-containing protein [Streptosporangiaceae bacterium NEAU-GS5]|nr:helix-turn-helix domain-containing protein [Streptosporangiaceae bacterium NEAU-GS5]
MERQPYTVDEVAGLLGLHVKTVRGYVRDGRLKATRIGRRYRIARDDLEAFTGHPVAPPARESARRTRHSEASSIVQVDAIGAADAGRVTTMVLAMVHSRPGDGRALRVETVYDEERATLKLIVLGGLAATAEVLRVVEALTDGGL